LRPILDFVRDFPVLFAFPDYSAEELTAIFLRSADGAHYRLSDGAKSVVAKEMERRWKQRGEDFATARDVRNLFERVIATQANRISAAGAISDEALITIEEADLHLAL
jgi:hypothetical protein